MLSIFNECIARFLGGKTRIIATHQAQYMSHPSVTKVIIMGEGGTILAVAPFSKLRDCGIGKTIPLLDELDGNADFALEKK